MRALRSLTAMVREHPPGLAVLVLTQMWERFSFYGMRALLVLYLTSGLFAPERQQDVLGYRGFVSFLEAMFGPQTVQSVASQIYGLYAGLVYLTPLLGGILADRYMGRNRAVIVGGVLIAAGHFAIVFHSAFLIALLLIVLGSGFFTPSVAAQVGALYARNDPRRDRGYSIHYLGVNTGACLAPIVCGTVGELYGWHLGFSLAGFGMLIGLIVFVRGRRLLPVDVSAHIDAGSHAPRGMGWRVIGALVMLTLLSAGFWATFEQIGNVLNLWLRDATDRSFFGWFELKVTWFQSINPLLILLLTPVILSLWARQASNARGTSTVVKMGQGCLFLAASYAALTIGAATAGPAGQASWIWTIGYLFLLTLGDLYLTPTSWALYSRVVSARHASTAMGVWYLAIFAGDILAGLLGTLWEKLPTWQFWLLMCVIPAGCGCTLILFRKLLVRLTDAAASSRAAVCAALPELVSPRS